MGLAVPSAVLLLLVLKVLLHRVPRCPILYEVSRTHTLSGSLIMVPSHFPGMISPCPDATCVVRVKKCNGVLHIKFLSYNFNTFIDEFWYFLVVSLGFSLYNICHLQTVTILLLSKMDACYFFLFSGCRGQDFLYCVELQWREWASLSSS